MNIYMVNIADNGKDSRINQILDFIAEYNGNPGLTELLDGASCEQLNFAIDTYASLTAYNPLEITGVLVYEDGFGDFIDGVFFEKGDSLVKVSHLIDDANFSLAVKVTDALNSNYPFEGFTTSWALYQINKNPTEIINNLLEIIEEN